MDKLVIDGSIGGGSVLRVAIPVALSMGNSISVINIRKNRRKSGLRLQHLEGLKLLAKLSNCELKGGQIGSTNIEFSPSNNTQAYDNITLKLATAASVSLIIQIMLNYCIANNKNIEFNFRGGGTHTQWAPNFDYLENVTKPMLFKFGIELKIEINKYGFYPKGGASGKIIINRIDRKLVNLNAGEFQYTDLISIASLGLKKAEVAERQIMGFRREGFNVNHEEIRYIKSDNPGSSLTSILHFENTIKGSSILGERGLKAEIIGNNLTELSLIQKLSANAVDKYMADQLIVPLAFSDDSSSYTFDNMTSHVKSNLDIIQKLLGNILKLDKIENGLKISKLSH